MLNPIFIHGSGILNYNKRSKILCSTYSICIWGLYLLLALGDIWRYISNLKTFRPPKLDNCPFRNCLQVSCENVLKDWLEKYITLVKRKKVLMYLIFFLLSHCATSHLVPVKKKVKNISSYKFLTESSTQNKQITVFSGV